jgi:hypothetical protein
MANTFASIMLMLWVPVVLVLFTQLPARTAASVAIVGAGVLLPNGLSFDFPGLPPLDRDAIGLLATLAGCLLFAPAYLRARRPGRGFETLALVMALGAFGTALTNADPLSFGPRSLPGLTLWDGIAGFGGTLIAFGLPLYLGRALFRKPADLLQLLVVLAAGGVAYSVLVLWEVRMSPHLHQTLYGYQPGQFIMSKRGSLWGWRPMVFVGHGISLSMMLLSCAVAAVGLWRVRARLPVIQTNAALGFLYAVLFACQSFGTFVYATFALPVIAWMRLRTQAMILSVLVVIVLTYPLARTFDIFPTRPLIDAAHAFSLDRANSLEFRFINEDKLIDHAAERVLFGWGTFGRNRPYDEETGRAAAITDGYWVIVLGKSGALGFLCSFCMLIGPVWAAARVLRRRRPSPEAVLVATAAWVVALNAIDLLPNGFINARMIFTGGALMGALEGWRTMPVVLPGKPSRSPPRALETPQRPDAVRDVVAR